MNESRRLHEPFIYTALAIALTAGFGFGAYLVLARAAGVPLGGWYTALAQAHGHAQLFGWIVLFILGIGLSFLPKLRGTNLRQPQRAPFGLVLLAAGVLLQSITRVLAGYLGVTPLLSGLLLFSALLELAGFGILLVLLLQTFRASKPLTPETPASTVEGFVQLALFALAAAFIVNLIGISNAVSQSKVLLAPRYDQMVITLLLYGTVIPMTFAFAIRTLPLYLRIVMSERGAWQTLTVTMFVAVILRLLPYALAVADDALILTGRVLRASYVYVLLTDALAVAGIVLLNICILLGIVRLNLFRKRGPRSDKGEYGDFHLLIYSAYAWLVVACVMDIVRALPYVNELIPLPQDAARHALMAGFITLMIFGIGVRMLPGLSGKRTLALPQLVRWLFVLGNIAAVLRVGAPILTNGSLETGLMAVSGVVGWLAVALFALLLVKTFRQP